MSETPKKALAEWGMTGAAYKLAAQRENLVYKVMHEETSFALRLHRPSYRTDAHMRSELQWMAMLSEAGLSVPCPIPDAGGAFLRDIDGYQVDLLTWLAGKPLGSLDQLETDRPIEVFENLGRILAQLHDASDAWKLPRGFERPNWLREGLLGPDPNWGRFWEHPHLTPDDRRLLLEVRERADHQLQSLDTELDQGMIHADALGENVLTDGASVSLIDFDDCAFGYRDFDLATALNRLTGRPDYEKLKAALFDGYSARRQVDPVTFPLFLLLRALTYVGWIMNRIDEPGGQARSARMIHRATTLAKIYLN